MKYFAMMPGWETELTEPEYRKFHHRYRQAGNLFQGGHTLDNGDIINLAHVNGFVCRPGEGETRKAPPVHAPGFMQAKIEIPDGAGKDAPPLTGDGVQGDTQMVVGPEGTLVPAKDAKILSKDEFMTIFNAQGLDYQAFAQQINYSPQTVRMAIKEGRISQALSDAVMQAFPMVSKLSQVLQAAKEEKKE